MTNEIGICEFTAEMQPDRLYSLLAVGMNAGEDLRLRYTVSVDPEAEPEPVTTASNVLMYRPKSKVGALLKLQRYDRYAHFRYLLTTESEPTGPIEITVEDVADRAWVSKVTRDA